MSKSSDENSVTFKDLLAQKQWHNYSQFITEAPAHYEKEMREDITREKRIREALRTEVLERGYTLRNYDSNLATAEKLLFNGQVIGIDGTVARHQMLSGIRCQIGVVAVNYLNEKIRHSYYISEANLRNDTEDVLEVLKRREPKNQPVSALVIRALMLYREREVAIRSEYKSNYKLLHGPLLPFELMTGLGRLRALYTTLDILKKLIADPKIFSIISTSRYNDYITLGTALKSGEYMVDEKFSLGDELAEDENFMAPGKWRPREFEHMEEFLRKKASRILTGVIKIGQRPYMFHAHRDTFDLAAAIIARDSLLQREKGFPLLIDYADTLCTEHFPAGDFIRLMNYQLAREGQFLTETDEREMRLK
ncbi:MAG: hypothetical protein L6R45_27570 [Anaerolineae bacterium]|nr:hypothetical protein [Anaerolineae bacterium]